MYDRVETDTAFGGTDLPHRQRRARHKREAILEAATRVFLEAGYAGASMDAITREAGVSKATVYSHFAGKEALFGAIVEARSRDVLAPLLTTEIRSNEPAATLRAVGNRFLDLIMDGSALALHRLVIAEAVRFPELARVFYENGPERAIRSLASYLSEQAALGRLAIRDPIGAAEQFFSLLSGYVQARALLGIAPRSDGPDLKGHVSNAVETFLRAYAKPR